MDLPVCWSCHQRFKWRELIFMVEGKTKCSNCMEKQYSTTHSKWRMGVLFLPLPFLAIILRLFSFPFLVYGAIVLALTLILYLFAPFLYQFTDKRQPLF